MRSRPIPLRVAVPARERGATLVVSLIMLLLLSLLAANSFTLAKGNLQIAGNLQQREQDLAAAQQAIELVVSTAQFTQTPAAALQNPCNGVANTVCVDVNGDGVTDVNVTVTPTCLERYVIPTVQLDFSNPTDVGCIMGVNQTYGVAGASNSNSACANTVWDTQAIATDVVSNAQYVVDEGSAVRASAITSSAFCPGP
jgi:Tfp pilus assembly protein PilX